MSEFYTQDGRLLSLITDAGKDVLLLTNMSIQEGISQPFRMTLRMLSETAAGNPPKVKPHDLVGTSFCIKVSLSEPGSGIASGERYWTGMCERFVQEASDDNFSSYSAVLAPWFSFLHYNTNCRIFQSMTVPDIVKKIVDERGFTQLMRMDLTKGYTARDYCVQYRETDMDFLSRLLESEGIYYYFEHSNGKHMMVLADTHTDYKTMPLKSSFLYAPVESGEAAEDNIRAWRVEEEMHPGQWTYRDFHHESPTNRFEVTNPSTDVAAAGKNLEIFDYPGDYAKKFNKVGSVGGVRPEGDTTVRLRMEKEETNHTVMSGASKCRVFTTGFKFTVTTSGFAQGTYLLTEARHDVVQAPSFGTNETPGNPYGNSFHAIPAARAFVPVVHIHPGIHGLQTATVIDESPSGHSEEIWPDEYGRVRVRFPWDRQAQYACWLRVVQPWAGKMWGQQWIPRVGDEVAVTFLEGDPDCPVVIGSLYNGDNKPIFSLPGNKTQSGILTHSTPGGGSQNYNMMRLEDKIGGEEIYVQAEKDLNSLVKNNETRTVKANRTSTIHVNDSRTVETGEDTLTVQSGDRTVTVHKNITTTSQTANIQTTAQQNLSATAVNEAITITAGTSISVTAGTSIVITAPNNITLKCGGSTIVMTPGNIAIDANMIDLNKSKG